MANGTGDGLTLLSSDQGNLLKIAGGMLSGLAALDPDPISKGVLSGIAGAFNLIVSLFAPDDKQAQINQLRQEMINTFALLEATMAADGVLNRKTDDDLAVGSASTALNDFNTAIQSGSLAGLNFDDLIFACEEALTNLKTGMDSRNRLWFMVYQDQEFGKLYWSDSQRYTNVCYNLAGDQIVGDTSDAGYGNMHPSKGSDGLVFDYRITLPLYLWAISAYLLVGRTSGLQFFSKPLTKSYLADAANALFWVYRQVMPLTPFSASGWRNAALGFTPLSPPDWTAVGLGAAACPAPLDGAPQPGAPGIRLVYPPDTPKPTLPSMAVLEYGAVERYSGASSIGDGYHIFFQGNDFWSPTVYEKLQIRILKRAKDLYRSIGLPNVRRAILQLSVAAAIDSPLKGPDFGDWSLREVSALTNEVSTGAPSSLRALARFLVGTQPYDTPYTLNSPGVQVSLRRLLDSLPD